MEFGEDYLTRPELVPARRAGELWGEGRVDLVLAGDRYLVSGVDRDQERALRERFAGWVRRQNGSDTATELRVYRAPEEEFKSAGTVWREYRLDLDYQRDVVRVAGLHVMAVVELGPAITAALWTSKSGTDFSGVVENVLRLVVAYRLLASERVLLHSAALVRDGSAVLFPGRSGAGKSTLCRLGLAAGWEVLSDELNVLVLAGDSLAVEQVPFTGDIGPQRTARPKRTGYPLRGACLLEKDAADRLTPVTAGRALGALLSTAPYVNRDPHRVECLEQLLEEAVRRGPASILGFSRESRLDVLAQLSPGGSVAEADAI